MRHPGKQLTFLLAGALLAGGVLAQAWPSKPITIIVPFPAGSANDIMGRVIGARMSTLAGQPVVVENRVGASSNIGMEATAKAAADGHTVAVASTSYVVNIYTLNGTRPLSAFTPMAFIGKLPSTLMVNAQVPASNVQELINVVRANKGKYNAAAGGPSGPAFLSIETFKRFVGPELELVVYKGTPEAETDLLAGRVHMQFGNLANALPNYKAGKWRLLAITGSRRSAHAPEVPTFIEQGFPQMDMSLWYALLGPAGIPRPVVARFNEVANKAMSDKDVMSKLSAVGLDVAPATPEELDAFLRQDAAMWGKAVKEAGILPQ